MSPSLKATLALSLCISISLFGCKHKEDDAQPAAAHAASVAPTPPAVASAAAAPAAAPAATPAGNAVAKAEFSLDSVPLSTATLPPFPYLEWPKNLAEGGRFSDKSDFDRAYVIAGNQLRAVEGRIETRRFADDDAQLTPLASQHNYENAIKALGGVKVNTVLPNDAALVAANGGDLGDLVVNKLRLKDFVDAYDAYLIRTPEKNVWLAVTTSSNSTQITAIEEKAMEQQVAFVTADAMQNELNAKGHIALHINFDTDNAVLKPDGLTAVDEIDKLLMQAPALKLSVQGHTDNSGNPQHNKTLSQQRADAVVANLLAKGIAKDRLNAIGLGADQPIADNGSEEGRAENRRVELVKQ